MKFSKILLALFPVVLTGCIDIFDEDSDSFYTPPPAAAPPPAPAYGAPSGPGVPPAPPAPPSSKPSSLTQTDHSCQCEESRQIPSSALPLPAAVVPSVGPAPDWHPSEGHLVRAGDLVMALQRANGGIRPSHAAMATHIQTNMALTPHQAEMVLEELGL